MATENHADRSRTAREMVALAGLAAMWAIAGWARGSVLPQRIPVHFGIDGRPDAWGTASQIFLMPAIALGLYLVLSVAVRFPQSFHYGVAVTEENRARLQATAIRMMGWMKAVVMWVMAVLVVFQVESARTGSSGGIGVAATVAPLAIFGVVVWLLVALRRAA